jgi:predicted ATPase
VTEERRHRLLLITGTMGAGKTTLMAETSDVLIERGIVHAAIDPDTLGIGLPPPSERFI